MTAEPELRGAVAPSSNGSVLTLTVTPRASRNQLELQSDGVLRLRVCAPPVDGAANTALLKFLARELGLPHSQLTLVSGESSRYKRVLALELSPEELIARLRQALAASN